MKIILSSWLGTEFIGYKDKHGRWHCSDGPAIEYVNGLKVWYRNGARHREDGPAILNVDGSVEYWKNNHKQKSGAL